MSNKIYIASDHAGFDAKETLLGILKTEGKDIIDLGCHDCQSVDYPLFAQKLAKSVLKDKTSQGILICGSGIGMDMAANRFKGIRAALCHNEEFAKLSRNHNNANVLVLPGRFLDQDALERITKTWLSTDFEAGRHQRRVEQLDNFE